MLTANQERIYKLITLGQWTVSQRSIIKSLHWWDNNFDNPATLSDIAASAYVSVQYVWEVLAIFEVLGYVTILKNSQGTAKRKGCIVVNFEEHKDGIPIDGIDRDTIQLLKEYEGK